jgi:proton-coupled amino acid transporter
LIIYIKVNVVAGFLFLPHGFYLGGWLFSVLSLILVALITGYCNIALASCADEVNSYSFTTIGTKAFGKCGRYIVDYGIAISQVLYIINL